MPKSIRVPLRCKRCVQTKPAGVSWLTWSRLEVGITEDGCFQVWCLKHDCEVFVTEPDTMRVVP